MIHGDVLCLSTWFSNICYKLVCLLTNRRYIIPLCLEEVILNIFWLGISAFILFKNVLLNYCMFNNTEQRTIPCLVKWVKNCFTNVTPLNSCVCVCVCFFLFFFIYLHPVNRVYIQDISAADTTLQIGASACCSGQTNHKLLIINESRVLRECNTPCT